MNSAWQFYQQSPTDPIHNPISGEFFSTEAVGNVAEALVREAIQNTLDARKKKADGLPQQAQACIYLSEAGGALPPTRAKRWFGSLWSHITAAGNGLRSHPSLDEPCPFLVYEDFGTVGLMGNPDEHRVVDGVANHFLNFFRAEGHSDKGEQDRGSWGVGKTVFPRASQISSFFGLTVRSDDGQQLLMGRSILKYHQVNDQSYKSDGYFGVQREDGFVLPTGNPATLAEFRTDFHVRRQSESGLSIIVPWYEASEDDGISRDKVLAAVLRGFFYPILMGGLSITVASPAEEIVLDANSIIQKVESLGGRLAMELLPVIKLAEWAQTRLPSEFRTLSAPSADRAQTWTPELIPAEVAKSIRQSLAQRERVALRVPLHVQPRNHGPQPTSFDVFLEHSENDSERPVFIRDELIISDVKPPRVSQVRAMVVAQDGPLATLLRDAETPAHTQWNQNTSHFKDKYKFGTSVLKFVRFSVSEVLRIVNQSEQQPDPSITIDFFSVPAPPEEESVPARRRRSRQKPGADTDVPEPPTPPRPPRRFRIDKLPGGFAIRPGDPGAPLPPFIDVRVAYDVRRGNPLKKYHRADFDVSRAPIRYDTQMNGVEVKQVAGNRILLAVQVPGFNLDVTGFDPDRDLYVKAEVKEAIDVD